MIVISPHLDDAVFSMGQTIANHSGPVTVATVFAGMPGPGVTPYEQSAGFTSSTEAVSVRIKEDDAALEVLGASQVLGAFLDRPQRTEAVGSGHLARWLAAQMVGHDVIAVPLGIHHPDHLLVAKHALEAATCTKAEILVYEELPYRVQFPLGSAARARQYTSLATETLTGPEKRAAVACYTSQLSETLLDCVFVPERVWRVA